MNNPPNPDDEDNPPPPIDPNNPPPPIDPNNAPAAAQFDYHNFWAVDPEVDPEVEPVAEPAPAPFVAGGMNQFFQNIPNINEGAVANLDENAIANMNEDELNDIFAEMNQWQPEVPAGFVAPVPAANVNPEQAAPAFMQWAAGENVQEVQFPQRVHDPHPDDLMPPENQMAIPIPWGYECFVYEGRLLWVNHSAKTTQWLQPRRLRGDGALIKAGSVYSINAERETLTTHSCPEFRYTLEAGGPQNVYHSAIHYSDVDYIQNYTLALEHLSPDWMQHITYRLSPVNGEVVLSQVYFVNRQNMFVMRNDPRSVISKGRLAYRHEANGQPLPEGSRLEDRVEAVRVMCVVNTREYRDFDDQGTTFPSASPELIIFSNERRIMSSYEAMMTNIMTEGWRLQTTLRFRQLGSPAMDVDGQFREWLCNLTEDFLKLGGESVMFEDDAEIGVCIAKVAIGRTNLWPMYKFFGRILGMAFFHDQNIGFRISVALMAMIQGVPIKWAYLAGDETFSKMKNMIDEAKAEGMEAFEELYLGWTQDVEAKLPLHLLIDRFDEFTMAHAEKWLDAYAEFRAGRAMWIVEAIREGINDVVPLCLLQSFTASELAAIICGRETIQDTEWTDLIRPTANFAQRPGGLNQIAYLKRYINEASLLEKKQLLKFWTGSSRVKSSGMAAMVGPNGFRVDLHRHYEDARYMPEAHTCFAAIDMVIYPNYEAFKAKLYRAVTESAGAGLQLA